MVTGNLARVVMVLAVLAGLGGLAGAQRADRPEELRLKVGKPTPFSPGFLTVQTICDDPSLVKIDADENGLVLTGQKPGQTLCSFWRQAGLRRLYRVIVTEK